MRDRHRAGADGILESAHCNLAPHRLNEAKVAFEATIIEKGNRKLVIESNRECHHCAGAHPGLCRTCPDRPGFTSMDESGAMEPAVTAPNHQRRFARIPLLGPGGSYTMDGKAAVPSKRLANAPSADAGLLLNFHYPNT